ncbi:MAG: segregation/condensation protein A [Lachnospiraceae bacterium]|jgi:segregation and condensation protein A|nr:segregation/condensation protein A [Lachnospiraceae bacterium]
MQPALSVKLNVFEGPLDLLLHLIDKNKVNIYDIPIAQITNQYMEYVQAMDKEDLDLVSDFLVMAATLLDIKSRMLLPAEAGEDGEEEDPRQELVERLLEYKMYKYMAGELKDRQQDAGRLFFKPETIPEEVAKYRPPVDLNELLSGLTLVKLNDIFQTVLKRQEDKIDPVRSKFGRIEREPFRVSDKIMQIVGMAAKSGRMSLSGLLKAQTDRIELVVTFLAVLELMKMGSVTLTDEGEDLILEASEELKENTEQMAEEIAASIDA